MPDSLPTVRFARITEPTRRHSFFYATADESLDRLLASYDREDGLTAEPFELTAPEIVAETRAWVADVQRDSDRPAMVMIGSVENGRWVQWNLTTIPCPPVPSR